MSILNDIKLIECKRKIILTELVKTRLMLRGSFGKNYRRCGKASCWCAKAEEGHPHYRITWGKNSQAFTRVIPKEDVDWIKIQTQAFKQFKKLRRLLRELNDKQRALFDKLEDEIIGNTNKLREYL